MNWILLVTSFSFTFCVPAYMEFETKALCEKAKAVMGKGNPNGLHYQCVAKTAKADK